MPCRHRLLLALVMSVPLGLLGLVLAETRFEECSALERAALRAEVNALSQELFESELGGLDLERVVHLHWLRQDMDGLIRAEAARAAEQVRSDTGYATRLWSSWSPGQARELAERMAAHAFGSEAFRQRTEMLAEAVATDVTRRFEMVANRSATEAVLCVRLFVGGSYGQAAAAAFERELVASTAELDVEGAAGIDLGVPAVGGLSALGAATIASGYLTRAVMQRVARDMSRRIAGRIAVRVAGRVGASAIPVVGWVAGLAMIGYDLVSGADGALTTIQEQLESDEVQAEIRTEIAETIRQELPLASAEIARAIADEVFFSWQAFRDNYRLVLATAEDLPAFQAFLAEVAEDELYALSAVASALGEEGLRRSFEEGTLAQLLELPEGGDAILAYTGSAETTLAWHALARASLGEVARLEVYRHKAPGDFSADSLARLLRLGDAEVIAKLVLLPASDMERLLGISTTNLRALGRALSADELNTLAWYHARLAPEDADTLILALSSAPAAAARFRSDEARSSILASPRPSEAIRFIASDPAARNPFGGLGSVLRGGIPWRLFWSQLSSAQHALLAALLGLLLLALLALVAFLLRPILALFRGPPRRAAVPAPAVARRVPNAPSALEATPEPATHRGLVRRRKPRSDASETPAAEDGDLTDERERPS